MNKERGKFMVYEGLGGSGKTTVIEDSKSYLQERGIKVEVTREPGGVKSSERIRELIFELKGENLINADHQMALFFAARKFLIEDKVGPGLENGINHLKDRGNASTNAYQGYGEGRGDPEVLARIEGIAKVIMGEYQPDAIILLDISAETSLKRNKNYKDGDPFDDLGLEWTRRVVDGYREMAQNNWSGVPWFIIDAEKPIAVVQKDVREILMKIINENK